MSWWPQRLPAAVMKKLAATGFESQTSDTEKVIADIAVIAVAQDQNVAENSLAETRDVDQRLSSKAMRSPKINT